MQEWQKYPYETRPEEADNLAKRTEDHWGSNDNTQVYGADSLRKDPPGKGVRNPYGWLGTGKETPEAEVRFPPRNPKSLSS